MTKQKKIRRKPTKIAIVVGTISFFLSCGIITGICIFIFPFAKQFLNSIVLNIVFYVVPFLLLFIALWLTVFFMETFEKITGINLRTTSKLH
jgi:EamA domain-containing membrane protein RarD